MPPSENSAYLNLPGRGRCPSGKLKAFTQKINGWCSTNAVFVQELRERLYGSEALHVDLYFLFHWRSLYTKDGRVKRLDAQNRIKCALDALGDVIAIDDRHIFSGSYAKLECDPATPERCIVVIRKTICKDKVDLNDSLTLYSDSFTKN